VGAPPPSFYFEKLYPLQDEVLAVVSRLDTGLYLTGVTAASRAYLLLGATRSDWELVRWIDAPDVDRYLGDLRALGGGLVLSVG